MSRGFVWISRLRNVLPLACIVALAPACAGRQASQLFSQEFGCPARQVSVQEYQHDQFRVTGCEMESSYDCSGQECIRDAEAASPPVRTPVEKPTTVRLILPEEKDRAKAATRKKEKGRTKVSLDLELDEGTSLRLRAAPEEFGPLVQAKLVRQEKAFEVEDCDINWMVNGQRLKPLKATSSRVRYTSTLRADIPKDYMATIAGGEQFALKVCDLRWSLRHSQIAQLQHFVALYHEELAWAGEAKSPESAMFVAPASGWPAWSPLPTTLAAATAGAGPDGQRLFKLVSPSVYRVEVTTKDGKSLGSAVAVSKTELVTNCHVLQGAVLIQLKQNKSQWSPQLVSSDPGRDRCVLRIDEPALTPVPGARPYKDLAVGEAAYTIGAPSGLDLTLSNGIVSGLREEGELRYVQTTAPISPGSSGGGLFDARGNLIGITTLVLVGKENRNQNLNFAIPSEIFFAP